MSFLTTVFFVSSGEKKKRNKKSRTRASNWVSEWVSEWEKQRDREKDREEHSTFCTTTCSPRLFPLPKISTACMHACMHASGTSCGGVHCFQRRHKPQERRHKPQEERRWLWGSFVYYYWVEVEGNVRHSWWDVTPWGCPVIPIPRTVHPTQYLRRSLPGAGYMLTKLSDPRESLPLPWVVVVQSTTTPSPTTPAIHDETSKSKSERKKTTRTTTSKEHTEEKKRCEWTHDNDIASSTKDSSSTP